VQVWRPSLDDVQRISTGDAAKHRGTGSRAVPHRLNAEERKAYDLAKQVSSDCHIFPLQHVFLVAECRAW